MDGTRTPRSRSVDRYCYASGRLQLDLNFDDVCGVLHPRKIDLRMAALQGPCILVLRLLVARSSIDSKKKRKE